MGLEKIELDLKKLIEIMEKREAKKKRKFRLPFFRKKKIVEGENGKL